jgi:AhpD family alkylhydroperoxidase
MMRTMAQSPAVLQGYLALSGALAGGVLGAKCGEELALAIAQMNECGYCAAAHSALGRMAGLTLDQIATALNGGSSDARTSAAIRLARRIVEERGDVADEDLAAARAAGLGEPEIAEIVAHVALNVLTNYFNRLAHTEIDFPQPLAPGTPAR